MHLEFILISHFSMLEINREARGESLRSCKAPGPGFAQMQNDFNVGSIGSELVGVAALLSFQREPDTIRFGYRRRYNGVLPDGAAGAGD